jgi:hypothetical protein
LASFCFTPDFPRTWSSYKHGNEIVAVAESSPDGIEVLTWLPNFTMISGSFDGKPRICKGKVAKI